MQLTARFPSLELANEVRELLLMFPERAIEEPDALPLLVGQSLPDDTLLQLKVAQSLLLERYGADCDSIFSTGQQ